jgi:hypothetical protein
VALYRNLQVEYFSFDQQISCFESVKKAMIAKIGKEAAEETVNAAMFQIGLGKATNFSISVYQIHHIPSASSWIELLHLLFWIREQRLHQQLPAAVHGGRHDVHARPVHPPPRRHSGPAAQGKN